MRLFPFCKVKYCAGSQFQTVFVVFVNQVFFRYAGPYRLPVFV